jgi:hypothetical protein
MFMLRFIRIYQVILFIAVKMNERLKNTQTK